jgi:hypothetical protein
MIFILLADNKLGKEEIVAIATVLTSGSSQLSLDLTRKP